MQRGEGARGRVSGGVKRLSRLLRSERVTRASAPAPRTASAHSRGARSGASRRAFSTLSSWSLEMLSLDRLTPSAFSAAAAGEACRGAMASRARQDQGSADRFAAEKWREKKTRRKAAPRSFRRCCARHGLPAAAAASAGAHSGAVGPSRRRRLEVWRACRRFRHTLRRAPRRRLRWRRVQLRAAWRVVASRITTALAA